ncbi:butyrophilin subfamily 1 member A1-like isoform X3 [Rhea pennata]|uniref:butyrophilin subfamily 1 member A1-like isoform X3 n=1 Tax=Rhea pennata TaxID=8795 RepID=UPI002E252E40
MAARMKLLSFFHAGCSLPCVVICFLMLCVLKLEAAQFSWRGTDNPILLVIIRADTVLPCHLHPTRSPQPVEVTWLRVPHSWPQHNSHKGMNSDRAPGHDQKTVLLKRWTCGGHADLRLSNVGPSDEGHYICFIRNRIEYEGVHLELKVTDFLKDAYPGMAILTMNLTVLGFIGFIVYLSKTKGWQRFMNNMGKAKMTLDPNTAHPWLLLSKDSRGVRWGEEQQEWPERPERFDAWCCVLGREGFTMGRHVWEVTVGCGKSWGVGLARASLKRKGRTYLSPEEGVWAVVKLEDIFRALTSPERTPLPQRCIPRRIRVSLEYDKGQVAFSNAETDAPIFTFPPASLRGRRSTCGSGCGTKTGSGCLPEMPRRRPL